MSAATLMKEPQASFSEPLFWESTANAVLSSIPFSLIPILIEIPTRIKSNIIVTTKAIKVIPLLSLIFSPLFSKIIYYNIHYHTINF